MRETQILEIAEKMVVSYERAKKNLFVKVLNGDDLIMEHDPVHTDFEDLSLLYYVLLDEDSKKCASAVVTEELLEKWGISQETLHDDAIANCERMYPSKLFDLSEFFGMMGALPMVVVTNERHLFGATSLFYPGVVKKLSDMLGGNFIVLPSSIHEIIAIPDTEDAEGMARMVAEINGMEVDKEDQLSDHVYRYSKDENKIRLVA